MNLPEFKLETYFAEWEFKAPHLLCCSDMQTIRMNELLNMADSSLLERWNSLSLGYTETKGDPELRREISQLYSYISQDEVLVCPGAEEAIYATFKALITSDDHVLVFTPCYESLQTIPESTGASVTAIPLSEENNWKIDLSLVRQSVRPNTKWIILNAPHNPTGAIPDRSTIDGLIEIAKECDAYIFCDEVYRYLEICEEDRLPPIVDLYEKGISCSVLSKAFGLSGLRIGWIACRNQKALDLAQGYKHYLSICNSAPSEVLGIIALRNRKSILSKNRALLLQNFNLLSECIESRRNVLSWIPPKGSCTGVVRLKSNESIDLFANRLVEQEGVLILPASVYNMKGNYFRIGFGRANFADSLKRFERFLES